MNRLLFATVLGNLLVAGCSRQEPAADLAELTEASINLDLEQLEPFLTRVSGLVQAGFGSAEVASIATATASQSVDSEEEYRYTVEFQGQSVPMVVKIVMDDIHSPDVAIFTAPGLARGVNSEIERLSSGQ